MARSTTCETARMRHLAAVVIGVAMVVALPACGGDDDDALTATEFKKQANAICEQGSKEIEKAATDAFADLGANQQPDPDSPEAKKFLDAFVDNIDGQLNDIDDLQPPKELEDDVDDLLDTAHDELDAVEEKGPDILLTQQDPFEDSNKKADDLGLTKCA